MRARSPHSIFLGVGLAWMLSASAASADGGLLQRLTGLGDEDEDLSNGRGDTGPFDLPAGTRVERDVAWGPDPAQRFDVYLPKGVDAAKGGAAIVLMVHGGAWALGDKAMWRTVRNKVNRFVGNGWIVVSTNYRMLPAVQPLAQADDVARALAAVQANAAAWGGDAGRVVLVGHSAGAHLVALLAADRSIAARQGAKPWIGTVALDSAALNVEEIMQGRHYRLYDRAFGTDVTVWREASPTLRLKAAPIQPLLLVCSSRRKDSCPQARAFADKATALGGRATVLPIDLSHGDINDQLGVAGSYTHAVEAFFASLGLRPAATASAPGE